MKRAGLILAAGLLGLLLWWVVETFRSLFLMM